MPEAPIREAPIRERMKINKADAACISSCGQKRYARHYRKMSGISFGERKSQEK